MVSGGTAVKRGGERAERKKGGREKSAGRREGQRGVGHTARVPQYSTIPACAPLRSCRYAAHPRISSPLGSHVIERSPSRGETQPIHILCSPLYILRRERKRERERQRERERKSGKEERQRETDVEKETKGEPEGDERDG